MIDTELYPDLKISSSEQVIVRAPQYFKDLFKLINVTETRYPALNQNPIKSYIRDACLCWSGQCQLCDHCFCVCCLYVLPVYYLLCSITESRLLSNSAAANVFSTLAPGQLPITSYGDQFCPESPPWADAFSTDTWILLGLVNHLLILTLHQSLDKNTFAEVKNIHLFSGYHGDHLSDPSLGQVCKLCRKHTHLCHR